MGELVAANWIADTNPYNLGEPPAWWLAKLYDFDHMLVLMPSRKQPKYMLARRRQLTAGIGDVAMLDNKNEDTLMLYAHQAVPVGYLNFSGNWTIDSLLADLKARDIWAMGGADKTIRIVEDAEATAEIKRRRELRDNMNHRAGDAYRSLKARTGQRVTVN